MRINNKTLAIVISILLMISIGTSITILPTATAHTPAWDIPTFAKIVAVPSPIGVGQTTTIYMFLGNPPFENAALVNDYRYRNYILTITAPDGTAETKTFSYISDPTNSQFYPLTPNQVGTYTFNFTFPGQKINDYSHSASSAYVNDTYLPSSASTTLTVQQEPIPSFPNSYALPTEYWARPIYGENIDWWSISSNWLGTGIGGYGGMPGPNNRMFSGDSIGSLTSHVMWTKPLQSGGVVGGNNFVIQGDTWFEGSAYNQRFVNPIIVHGRLYYTETVSFTGVTSGPTNCVDLRTGEVIWSRNDVPALSFAYIYSLHDPQQHGVFPAILFTSNFARAFDADTGNPMFNVTGVPSGTAVQGPQGEMLRYVIANAGNTTIPNWRLGQWNSTNLWSGMGFPGTLTTGLSPTLQNATNNASWSMTGSTMTNSFTVDASPSTGVFNRYDWNISIPWRNTMTLTPTIIAAFFGNMLICRNGSYPGLDPTSYIPYTYFAVNLNASRGTIGSILWMNTVDPPAGDKKITSVTYAGADPTVDVFTESYRQTSQFVGYSMATGKQIWGPTPPQIALDYYGSTGPGTLASTTAYGKLYSSAYGGILYTYDLTTGELLWTYGNGDKGNSTNSGFAVPGNYPIFVNAIGNDVVYLISSEHTIQTPIYKGALLRAVNATTGQEIWTLSSINNEFATSSFAIADGFVTTFNGYDNQIYSIGRGPSATTVSAPNIGVAFNTPIVIKGSVMDISSGTRQNEQAARFPNGVPVASDDSISDWMGYIYQQKPQPSNFAGVQVTLSVVDSNGNYRSIGTTKTDTSGTFRFTWLPDIPGDYTLFASFSGSNGYWPSYAEESFNVMQEPTSTAVPTPAPATMTDTYVLGSTIAIIIAIAIVGALIVLMVRKRP